MEKFSELINSFGKAINRLDEVLKLESDEFIRDSAIKRFELCFDLSWKTLKACLEGRGLFCASPKSCFQEAFREGLIDYEEIWIKMIDTRNETVHTYNEATAEEIYSRLPIILEAFRKLLNKIANAKN